MPQVIFEITLSSGIDPGEELGCVLGRLRPKHSCYLGEDGGLLWHFSSLLFLGYKVASGAEERRAYFEPNKRSGRPEDPLTGLKFVDILDSNRFTSVGQITTATKLSRSTVLDPLNPWGYTVRHSE
jgi:hypothetical protein